MNEQPEPKWPYWWGLLAGRVPATVMIDYGDWLVDSGFYSASARDHEVYSYVVVPQ